MSMYTPSYVCGGQKTICGTQFSPSITESLGIELRLSGLAASTFPYWPLSLAQSMGFLRAIIPTATTHLLSLVEVLPWPCLYTIQGPNWEDVLLTFGECLHTLIKPIKKNPHRHGHRTTSPRQYLIEALSQAIPHWVKLTMKTNHRIYFFWVFECALILSSNCMFFTSFCSASCSGFSL